MKNFRLSDFLWTYLFIMVQLIDLLVEPLIFVAVGIFYKASWQYYVTIFVVYYALTAIWELIVHFTSKDGSKKFHSPFVRRFKRVLARLSQAEENVEKQPPEAN